MLKKLLSAINDCAWAYDLSEQKYVFISPNIHSVLGISANMFSEDNGLRYKIAIPEDQEMIQKTVEDIKLDDWAELHYRIKVDGKIKWLFEKRTRFIDDTSGHELLLSVIKDVTDQNVINYYLNDSLGDFRILFEGNSSPMWIYETPSLRIIKVNQAAIEYYGYSQDEFLAMAIRDIRPKIDLAAFNEYIFRKGITKGMMRGHDTAGIWKHQNRDGQNIYVEITGHEISYNNTSCRIMAVTDITKRIHYQQEKSNHEKINSPE
jgi:PAS domain S-box-containing protein